LDKKEKDKKEKDKKEKYENSPVMDVKYYNTVGRCDCCLKKDAHIEKCCYEYIRPLPYPEK